MTSGGQSYVFPEEHSTFLAEYRALIEKYPEAAGRFFLADLGGAMATAGPPPGVPETTWECTMHDGILECTHSHPQ